MKKKIVYTVICADGVHAGHMKVLEESSKLGNVIVGLLTDKAISEYKRVPIYSYEQRKEVVENIKGVWKVVPQHTLDYTDNLRKYKPDIVTNGEDWRVGVQKETRQKVIDVLKEWNGQLVEIPILMGAGGKKLSSTDKINALKKRGITPEQRRASLRRLIQVKPLVRILEAHSGLSALIVENTKIDNKKFDGIWESSFTDSSSKGKPDIELVDFTSRLETINQILEVTSKPIIVDLDTGGQTEHFCFMVKTLERLGVSAVVIEDKKFPKRNSLMEGAKHIQESKNVFSNKIKTGKFSQVTDDFMIIARIESFILGKKLDDAIDRARAYIEAGADGILIHSKESSGWQVVEFSKEYSKFEKKVPLFIVPTTYDTFKEREMVANKVSVVIYANQLLRASYSAMKSVAENLLFLECSRIGDDYAKPKEIFNITNKGVKWN